MNCCSPSSSGLEVAKLPLQSDDQMKAAAKKMYDSREYVFPVEISALSSKRFPKQGLYEINMKMTPDLMNQNVFINTIADTGLSHFVVKLKDRKITSPDMPYGETVAALWKYCNQNKAPNGALRILKIEPA